MTLETASALILFAFVTSVTPGPNNLMLLASGARFGVARTVPHMLGISIGHSIMVVLVGLGAMPAFEVMPVLPLILKGACLLFLAYLAVKLALAPPLSDTLATGDRPMTFVGAALFQWVNPKAWAMALTAISLYAADRSLASVVLVAVVFSLVNLPSVAVWAGFGTMVRRALTSPGRQRAFNLIMATLLILSVLPML
jgi:threonine/homoserine/homoserine lactone efflux protein